MLIRDEELEKCVRRAKGTSLYAKAAEAGRAAVWTSDDEVCFQNHVSLVPDSLGGANPFFAYRYFEKLSATGEINAHRKGIGISNMSSSKSLAIIPFPLPPLEEQSRIVAKVDELMALCDKLETQQQARRKLQNALRQSTCKRRQAPIRPARELQTTWVRLADNFGRLFHAPADVDDVVAELKNLAVRGLLTEASVASPGLDAIKADCSQLRAQYITDGLMRRQKLVGMADCEEIYPDHWGGHRF